MSTSGGDREGERERTAVDVSKRLADLETGALWIAPGQVWRVSVSGQAGSGMEAARVRSAAFAWNRRRRARILSARGWGGGRERRRGPGLMTVGGVRVPSPGTPADRLVVVVKPL